MMIKKGGEDREKRKNAWLSIEWRPKKRKRKEMYIHIYIYTYPDEWRKNKGDKERTEKERGLKRRSLVSSFFLDCPFSLSLFFSLYFFLRVYGSFFTPPPLLVLPDFSVCIDTWKIKGEKEEARKGRVECLCCSYSYDLKDEGRRKMKRWKNKEDEKERDRETHTNSLSLSCHIYLNQCLHSSSHFSIYRYIWILLVPVCIWRICSLLFIDVCLYIYICMYLCM